MYNQHQNSLQNPRRSHNPADHTSAKGTFLLLYQFL
jgi:hypothetical protein